MSFKERIDVQWCGYRKDGDKGAAYGWFVLKDQPTTPAIQGMWFFDKITDCYRINMNDEKNYCYTFRVKVGKSAIIEKHVITRELLFELKSKAKNFKRMDFEKLSRKWGVAVNNDFESFLLFELLKV